MSGRSPALIMHGSEHATVIRRPRAMMERSDEERLDYLLDRNQGLDILELERG